MILNDRGSQSFRQTHYIQQQRHGFSGIVKEFVINTIDMVKKNIREEEDIIEHMLVILQDKMSQVYHRQTQKKQKVQNNSPIQKIALQKIYSAVQQLNKDSDVLSERLFDLSQALIQKRMIQMQHQKREIEKDYENKLASIKIQYQYQKAVLQKELKQRKQKCSILEECLETRQGYIRKESEKQDQYRRHELVKYLQVIEEIYEELQILKNFSGQPSLDQSQPYQRPSLRTYADNYSEQYYNIQKDEGSTQTDSQQLRVKSPSKYNYVEYQNSVDRRTYVSRQQQDLVRKTVERRSNSKSKQIMPRYAHISSPRQNYYIKSESEKRERSRSSEKEKIQKRDSNQKLRPIILHYQTPTTQIKFQPPRQSEIYTRRSSKLDNESQFKRIVQKNTRMQRVEQKLHGLKRKLERQLKTMKI